MRIETVSGEVCYRRVALYGDERVEQLAAEVRGIKESISARSRA